MAFIERFASGYTGTYGDFFKQWHYKMKIQEKCADPTTMQAFGQAVQQPAETYYPPATVCARSLWITADGEGRGQTHEVLHRGHSQLCQGL